MNAFQLPKETAEEKSIQSAAIESASVYATEIPLKTMQVAQRSIEILSEMVEKGNPNSMTDAAVGLLCIKTALRGAYYNVMVNAKGLKDQETAKKLAKEAESIISSGDKAIDSVLETVEKNLAF